ncbi:hypothetical protein [Streptomyces sp. NPDC060205]|uniref:hypothetical protein n=1 Tax=Streptomyces sp. NPDC060205 TaxID=3347072 RepID=UPI00365290FC
MAVGHANLPLRSRLTPYLTGIDLEVVLEGKRYEHPVPKPSRETELAEETKKGPNWAAGSFALNLWRTWRDWMNSGE